jgi:hypothetical protein
MSELNQVVLHLTLIFRILCALAVPNALPVWENHLETSESTGAALNSKTLQH